MKKVKLMISVNSIYFGYTSTIDTEADDLTTYIDTGKLVFSVDYIINNPKLLTELIKDITNKNNIDSVKIKNMDLVPLICKIIKPIKTIKKLYILDKKCITSKAFASIIDNQSINYLKCYDMPALMFNYLDNRKNIIIDIEKQIDTESVFLNKNKLTSYSNIFYKKSLNIFEPLSAEDLNNLESFVNINNSLKNINVLYYDFDSIEKICNLIKDSNYKQVLIKIYEKKDNTKKIIEDIEKLKKFKKNNIEFKIKYSNDFLFKNMFKQINIATIRTSVLVIVISLIIIFGLTEFKSFDDDKNTENMSDVIENIKENTSDETTVITEVDDSAINDDDSFLDDLAVAEKERKSKGKIKNSYTTKYDKVLNKLVNINPDTVGWLTVKNTGVDYPVVQSSDNNFYLKHSFDKSKNTRGWVYVDYRADMHNFSDNTIIFGHNLKSGLMFGTLQKTLANSWYTNTDNQKIIFNTLNGDHTWQIFSIYTMDKTNDYLVAHFANETNFNKYIKNSKAKSVYDFKTDVKYGDKLLTLSTCYKDSNHRLVIQAKLIQ